MNGQLSQRIRMLLLGATLIGALGCGPPKTVVLRFDGMPDDALVTINDRYIGKLGRLKKKGVKLPAGDYRVTVEQVGYFPHDQLVRIEEERQPPAFKVELTPVPD